MSQCRHIRILSDVRYVDCKHCGQHCLLAWDVTSEKYLGICDKCQLYDYLDEILNDTLPT